MKDKLISKDEHVYELPQEGNMRVPGRIYSSQSLLEHPGMDSAIQQVANVATLQRGGIECISCIFISLYNLLLC